MTQIHIAVVVGSLRHDSFNGKMASALARLNVPECSFERLEIGDLPLYNQDDDANQAESVKRLQAAIAAADGVLKNAIDHASRPYGQSAWMDMPTLAQPEAFMHAGDKLFDDSGDLAAGSRQFLQHWLDRYLAWVRLHVR